ncbi:acyltransferase domain-containing protein [Ferrovum sp. JA12]|uniref:acyltransferase domain-containing protein n=1 Tax=Ferrovum sp. JA12 TaxID=1356299 RepID=UPI00070266C8|nr:acyltransferase domain-containing protein [Ferrovum sp. JA12]
MRLAIIFSGQGAQQMKHYHELSQAIATQHWPQSVKLMLTDKVVDEAKLAHNQFAQPLITALQLVRWQRLSSQLAHSPILIAGYSAGESASYAAAGVWSEEDALAISLVRSRLMDQAIASLGPCALAYIEEGQTPGMVDVLAQHGVFGAITLAHGGLIVGGETKGLLAVASHCTQHHMNWRWLPISVPSHTPLMHGVEQPLLDYLATLKLSAPLYPLLAGGVSAVVSSVTELKKAFAYQTCHLLDWHHCLSVIREYRPQVVLEIGPGNALASMVRELDVGIMARSLDEFHSDGAVMDWLGRWC